MFENLKNLLAEEAEKEKAVSRFYIQNGFCESWAEDHKQPGDNGLRNYSTPRRWEQYQAGQISREKAVQYAIARREKELGKLLAEKLEKLERAAAAGELLDVSISVEWKRNRTWGYNPTATVTVHSANGWEQFTGTASGCGYDKRTAAIGSALNQSAAVLKMLYNAKETALNNPPEKGRYCGAGYFEENTSNNSLIHYGAGYGVLPYFEGGVGMSSFKGVFEKCGFICENEHETRTTDYYFFVKKEAR